MGVKKGERIAYLGKNSDVYFELLLGAMKANVVMAPVNWRLAGPEIAFIVEDCRASVLFVYVVVSTRTGVPRSHARRSDSTSDCTASRCSSHTSRVS